MFEGAQCLEKHFGLIFPEVSLSRGIGVGVNVCGVYIESKFLIRILSEPRKLSISREDKAVTCSLAGNWSALNRPPWYPVEVECMAYPCRGVDERTICPISISWHRRYLLRHVSHFWVDEQVEQQGVGAASALLIHGFRFCLKAKEASTLLSYMSRCISCVSAARASLRARYPKLSSAPGCWPLSHIWNAPRFLFSGEKPYMTCGQVGRDRPMSARSISDFSLLFPENRNTKRLHESIPFGMRHLLYFYDTSWRQYECLSDLCNH